MESREHDSRNVKGNIHDLLRCSIHDGPGIRTTVFMKGCPLRCLWCHNPESQETYPELSYSPEKCIGCGKCAEACKHGCHAVKENPHYFDRTNCGRCFACLEVCYKGALKRVGDLKTVDQVLTEVLKDRSYYEESGGGVTISGGEPTMQPVFLKALLKRAKEEGLHTCVETCGQASFDVYLSILEFVDIFLYDFKETDPKLHKRYTGVTHERILDNLFALDGRNAATILRCPIVPGLNDDKEHLKGIAKIASGLDNIIEVNVMPYHPYGNTKGVHVGRAPRLEGIKAPKEETVEGWMDLLRSLTGVWVCRG